MEDPMKSKLDPAHSMPFTVQLTRGDSPSLGFSVLGGAGSELPPVIYEILENTPASNCHQLQAGDVIEAVNDREVIKCTTKEDPQVKDQVAKYLNSTPDLDSHRNAISRKDLRGVREIIARRQVEVMANGTDSAIKPHTNGDTIATEDDGPQQPKFEAFMMTGDKILNLSKVSSGELVSRPRGSRLPVRSGRYRSPYTPPATHQDHSAKHSPLVSNGDVSPSPLRMSKSDDRVNASGVSSPDTETEEDRQSLLNQYTSYDTSSPDQQLNSSSLSQSSSVSSSPQKSPVQAHELLSEDSDVQLNADTDKNLVTVTEDHRIVLSIRGPDSQSPSASASGSSGPSSPDSRKYRYQELTDGEEDMSRSSGREDTGEYTMVPSGNRNVDTCKEEIPLAGNAPSLLESGSDSDLESLKSFSARTAPAPKAVDLPSAIRLANRLYHLDGFKKTDVFRHLCKNNDFSRTVAEEYCYHFDFSGENLDVALRKFLLQLPLEGETQERERVLSYFADRYLLCNPGSFASSDAVHTLTCGLMILNTDLHSQVESRHMSLNVFIEHLKGLNDGEDFPRDLLVALYQSVKKEPFRTPTEDEEEGGRRGGTKREEEKEDYKRTLGPNPFLDIPDPSKAHEYKRGFIMRKACMDPDGKKTPRGKRGWHMWYGVLRDLVLYVYKDQCSAVKEQPRTCVRLHHALAVRACDYTKRQHVLRLFTADQAQCLIQASDNREMESWIEGINWVAGRLSSPPLASPVSSKIKFQRPLFPSSITKLNAVEQLKSVDLRLSALQEELATHSKDSPPRGTKSFILHAYKDKCNFLQFEIQRFNTYSMLLHLRLDASLGNLQDHEPSSERYRDSYKAAIFQGSS
ncbi:unnamed protein product [Darwinula stevensoni]|uniref:Uncharacterized protein n=1 Tax=Darwinula stevensoni TaxID=69355 RepID=A0A7R9FR94_9CRUS|nr:unnamed protein product [Darwinula stevensoni]CAG0900571.1 unnamed protein product [Darwinula stevensoni]